MNEETICIGDWISLYSEDVSGYVFSYQSSTAHTELGIGVNQDRNYPQLPNPHAVVFEICAPNRYKLHKNWTRLKDELEKNPKDLELRSRHNQAQRNAETESRDNEQEQIRQRGKPLLYGQTLQLRHEYTGKYLHVDSTQTSWMETSNMMIELKPISRKTALFKILPRYKVKSEGDIIQDGDQIMLESIKSPGQYAHCSRVPYNHRMVYHGSHELNLAVRASGFTLHRFYKTVKDEQDAEQQKLDGESAPLRCGWLKGGGIVRLYHRELEAYLAAEGLFSTQPTEGVHMRIREMNPLRPSSLHSTTSAITFWQIEKETSPLDGSVFHWEDQCRIRHVTTRQYLCFAKATTDFGLTNDLRDPMTVFRILPVVKLHPAVNLESYVRFQHVCTGFWLHAESSKEYIRRDTAEGESQKWTLAKLRKVSAKEEMMYDDAFSLQEVKKNLENDVNFVAGMVPFLYKFNSDLNSGLVFTPRRLIRVTMALKELNGSMIINGQPTKAKQKLLRNFMVVDLIVEVIRSSISGNAQQSLISVYVECYKVLHTYLVGDSSKNVLYLSKHLQFFMDQLGTAGIIGLNAASLIKELLIDNRKMVDRITSDHLVKFCQLLIEIKDWRFLDLLMSLCICNGIAMSNNQLKIADLCLRDSLSKNQSTIYFLETRTTTGANGSRELGFISVDGQHSWKPVKSFAPNAEHRIPGTAGRNEEARSIILDELGLMSWKVAFSCLQDDGISDSLRASFCKLIFDLFIDRGENSSVLDRINLVFIYADIPLPGANRNRGERNDSVMSTVVPLPFVRDLKSWISQFLVQNTTLIASQIEKNHLIRQVIELVYNMAAYGYYGQTDEVRKILHSLVGLLDGRTDLPFPVQDQSNMTEGVKQLVGNYRQWRRYEKSPGTLAIVNVKKAVLKLAKLFFNFRFNTRLERFVSEFKQILNETNRMSTYDSKPEMYALLTDQFELDQSGSLCKKTVKMLEDMFSETSYFTQEFVDVMMVNILIRLTKALLRELKKDCCKYKYDGLVAHALGLVNRKYSGYENLFTRAVQAQVLLTEYSVKTMALIKDNVPKLRSLASSAKLSPANTLMISQVLKTFTDLCSLADDNTEPHRNNQQILYNYGILADVFDMLMRKKTVSVKSSFKELDEMFRLCFRLLRCMAREFPTVQERLFNRMRILMRIEGVEAEMGDLFIEIFNGNEMLCLQILPSHVAQLVGLLARSRDPVIVRLLSSILLVDGIPLKRNQHLVIKSLLEHRESIACFIDSDIDQLTAILTASDGDSETDLEAKRYLCNVVQLLSLCALGENKSSESICQCMVTMDELLDILNLLGLCGGVRKGFLQFLVSVFLQSTTELAHTDMADFAHNPKVWQLIQSLEADILTVNRFIETDSSEVRYFLHHEPTRIHVHANDEAHERKELVHFIVRGVLPFMNTFFKHNYAPSHDSAIEINEPDDSDVRCVVDIGEGNGDDFGEGNVEEEIADDESAKGGRNMAERQIEEDSICNRVYQTIRKLASEIHPCMSHQYQLDYFSEALTALGEAINIRHGTVPSCFSKGLIDPMSHVLKKHTGYYSSENELNQKLNKFAENVKVCYGGLNSVEAQIGNNNNNNNSNGETKQQYMDEDNGEELPLGHEFQQLVNTFVVNHPSSAAIITTTNNNTADQSAYKYEKVKSIEHQLRISRNRTKLSERDKLEQEELDVKCLLILRAIIHNEIVKLPNFSTETKRVYRSQMMVIRKVQEALSDLNVIGAVLPLISRIGDRIPRHTLSFLATILYGGNRAVQSEFYKFFLSTTDESFFVDLVVRMQLSASSLKEMRHLSSKQEDRANEAEALIKRLRLQTTASSKRGGGESTPGTAGTKKKTRIGFFLESGILSRRKSPSATKPLIVGNNDENDGTIVAIDVEGSAEKKQKIITIDGRKPVMTAAANPKFMSNPGNVNLVFKVLQLLCDGENSEIQNYFRDQKDNIKSINLVAEVTKYVTNLYGSISYRNIRLTIQLFDTLTEIVQGNPANQLCAFDNKVTDCVNHILNADSFPGCGLRDFYTLQLSIISMVRVLTEENMKRGTFNHSQVIMSAISIETLLKVVNRAHGDAQIVSLDPEDRNMIEDVTFGAYHLLKRNLDLNPGAAAATESMDGEVWTELSRQSASIEVMKNEAIQKVHFRVNDPAIISEDTKVKLKWEVDRSSPSNKLRNFLVWAKEIRLGIKYQRKLRSWWVGRTLMKRWVAINRISLFITIVINLIMVFGWSAPESSDPSFKYSVEANRWHPKQSDPVKFAIMGFGLCHNVMAFLVCLIYFLANRPTLPNFRRLFSRGKKEDKKVEKGGGSSGLEVYHLRVYLLLSILGTVGLPIFFSFHLLHFAAMNQLLVRVIQAVTLNGKSLVLVGVMALALFYIYTLVGFCFFRNIYAANELYCENIWMCFVTTVREGLLTSFGERFEIGPKDKSFALYGWKSIFDISFFILITTIGLNIIFGIIVDTFSQLRDSKWQIENDMSNTCFICSRTKYEFEHHAKGFDEHVKEEHNMWTYLFFLIHLDDSRRNDLSSLELHVFRQVEQEKYEFFPLGKAMCLMHMEDNESDKRMEILMKQVDKIVKRIEQEESLKHRQLEKLRQEEWKKKHDIVGNIKPHLVQTQKKKGTENDETDRNGTTNRRSRTGGHPGHFPTKTINRTEREDILEHQARDRERERRLEMQKQKVEELLKESDVLTTTRTMSSRPSSSS